MAQIFFLSSYSLQGIAFVSFLNKNLLCNQHSQEQYLGKVGQDGHSANHIPLRGIALELLLCSGQRGALLRFEWELIPRAVGGRRVTVLPQYP